ncbi:MAG: signal recognition particle protein [Psittacicella sp.]
MFASLSDRLSESFKKITGKGRLTEDNIKQVLREVRIALLEADVALPVVKEFINQVKEKSLGVEVNKSLTPGQEFIKIVQKELENIMGEKNEELNLAVQPPAIILMAGLQGAGKTTSVAKLAKFLKETKKKKVLVVSADIYRPAAIDQLRQLALNIDCDFFESSVSENPVDIANKALSYAKLNFFDVLIVDTAGRLHIDEDMMTEIKDIYKALNPIETLFVVDSMTGQDAANTAKAFNESLDLTGIILTKVDGDSRAGAALSIRKITNKPIKFLGVGEKTDALEPFYPDRIASRILGMGDVLSLIETLETKVDKEKAKKISKKIKKGENFTLEDFREQLIEMRRMGGVGQILDKLPGQANMPADLKDKVNDSFFEKMVVIINSMTPKERNNPEIIKGSRKQRIVNGSGTTVQDLNKLLKQFREMQTMMKKLSNGGMGKLLRGLGGMGGMGNMANLASMAGKFLKK